MKRDWLLKATELYHSKHKWPILAEWTNLPEFILPSTLFGQGKTAAFAAIDTFLNATKQEKINSTFTNLMFKMSMCFGIPG